uniref:Uncharacterized protein n=1 Tax=Syphacia muris TaxID=451379 RepID=A0A0N5AKK1_9BILA
MCCYKYTTTLNIAENLPSVTHLSLVEYLSAGAGAGTGAGAGAGAAGVAAATWPYTCSSTVDVLQSTVHIFEFVLLARLLIQKMVHVSVLC